MTSPDAAEPLRVLFVCTANICRRRTPPRVDGDIADAYRRGAAAVEQAAGTITSMLSVAVPRLVGGR